MKETIGDSQKMKEQKEKEKLAAEEKGNEEEKESNQFAAIVFVLLRTRRSWLTRLFIN